MFIQRFAVFCSIFTSARVKRSLEMYTPTLVKLVSSTKFSWVKNGWHCYCTCSSNGRWQHRCRRKKQEDLRWSDKLKSERKHFVWSVYSCTCGKEAKRWRNSKCHALHINCRFTQVFTRLSVVNKWIMSCFCSKPVSLSVSMVRFHTIKTVLLTLSLIESGHVCSCTHDHQSRIWPLFVYY